MEKLCRIEIYRAEIPIHQPYHLSFTTVKVFETCFVCLITSEGQSAWAETTPLPGYSRESCDDVWSHLRMFAQDLLKCPLPDVRVRLSKNIEDFPFASSPFLTALDALEEFPLLGHSREIRYPIVGILNTDQTDEIQDAFEELVSKGYRTIKFKIGRDYKQDIEHAGLLSDLADAENVKIRLDANQGYSLEDARTFLNHIPSQAIEYIEQPLSRHDWDQMKILAQDSDLPFLLDESIWTSRDIRQAVKYRACSYIKCKLYKHGGLRETETLLREAEQEGLSGVIGNGVQSDLGCFYEAFLADKVIMGKTCGEMNGYLKQKTDLLLEPLTFDDGALCAKITKPMIDKEKLSPYLTDKDVYS